MLEVILWFFGGLVALGFVFGLIKGLFMFFGGLIRNVAVLGGLAGIVGAFNPELVQTVLGIFK